MKPLALAALIAAAPALAFDEKTRLYDLSADTLPAGEDEWGLFWIRYARGITPRLQLSTHLAGDLITLFNLYAKYRVLERDELRLSVEAGFAWPAAVTGLLAIAGESGVLLFLPLELRATVPLADNLELDLGWIGRLDITGLQGLAQGQSSLRMDVALARSDARGAWLALVRFPLWKRTDISATGLLGQEFSGVLTLDDLASWGVLIARDAVFNKRWHIRFGLGYRNTPGAILVESIGKLLVSFDLYYR